MNEHKVIIDGIFLFFTVPTKGQIILELFVQLLTVFLSMTTQLSNMQFERK